MAAPGVVEDVVEHWVARLKDAGALALPSDHTKTEQYAECEEVLDLNDATCTAILKLSLLKPEIRPFNVVLAAFTTVLHKFTREEAIVVGSTTDAKELCALRVDVTGKTTLEEVLTQTVAAEAEANQHPVDFGDVAMGLFPDETRASALAKIFQVCVLNGTDAPAGADIKKRVREDWTLYVENTPDAKRLLPLRFRLIFNSLAYSRKRIRDVLNQIEMVIKVATESAGTEVQKVSIVTEENTAVFPDPAAPLDDTWNGPVFGFLEKWAAESPERPLIVHKDAMFTYHQVNECANRLANYLLSAGIQKGERVAMYSHRSSAIVVGILGILKAGATFTVIDPAYPIERQIVYLEVSQPRGVVMMEAAGTLNAAVQEYIDTKLSVRCQVNGLAMTPSGVLAEASPENPGVVVGPDDIGTLSFTSGSTGLPKGVRGRHISLTHFYPWMGEEFGMGADDRFSMLSGIAHDPIQRDVFTPIFFGATIHIPDASDILNPGALAEWVRDAGVTVVHLTPAMGQLLTANASAEMPTLKVALFVGDVLTKRDIKRLQRLAANVVAVNMYGTTETQRAVSFLKVPNDNSIEMFKEILPSGKGMKDVQLLVLTDAGQLAGHGEMGEIFVRSHHMSAGYLDLPEATAAKFLPNPFTQTPGDRFYKSGDLGRFMADGSVECVGRADDQIKIRGFRIELGEIDTHLGQHEHVRENKTLVMRDAHEEKVIISYFVASTPDFSVESIRKHLKDKLPSYAVPTIICPIKKMPLTPNGKIDTRRLPYPDAAVIMSQHQHSDKAATELSPMGKKIHAVFEKVLGHPVHPSDDFFEVGGHSVLATMMTFTLRQELRQEFPLNLLYQCRSVEQLAEVLQQSLDDPSLDVADSAGDSVEEISLEAEVQLDASIAPAGREVSPKVQSIFLTGGTGFLGAFLLVELLKSFPTAVVRCLVRADSNSAGHARIETNLKNNKLWAESYTSRIIPIVGDLALPRFGLSDDAFAELGKVTDLILHNGALVHWVYPYSQMKAINVSSTVECLRLGTLGPTLAPVHFVSSTSVLDSKRYMDSSSAVLETESLEGFEGLSVGYAQTKFVSEKLILAAIDRGVPATIFRPGYVIGHSSSGVTNLDDYLARLVKGCIQLGKAPDMRNVLNACPVDYVSRAIVHVAAKADSVGRCYHFFPPTTQRFSDLFDGVMAAGYKVQYVDYLQWREDLMALTLSESQSNALYPLLHFVLDDLPSSSRTPTLDTTQLHAQLEGSAIAFAGITELMPTYLKYLVEVGFIGGPDADPAAFDVAGGGSTVTRNNRL